MTSMCPSSFMSVLMCSNWIFLYNSHFFPLPCFFNIRIITKNSRRIGKYGTTVFTTPQSSLVPEFRDSDMSEFQRWEEQFLTVSQGILLTLMTKFSLNLSKLGIFSLCYIFYLGLISMLPDYSFQYPIQYTSIETYYITSPLGS